MNSHDYWNRLAAIVRRAPEAPQEGPPRGFVTRVVARGLSQRRESPDLLGIFALRGLGVALAILVTSAAASYPLLPGSATGDEGGEDAVAELLARL